jgi:hypothetical protein
LIDFFGEILKFVKLNCDSVLRSVTGIARTISELRCFLPGPPEERAFFVREVIADYDPRCTAFGRTGNLPLPFTFSTLMNLIPQNCSEKCLGGSLKQTLQRSAGIGRYAMSQIEEAEYTSANGVGAARTLVDGRLKLSDNDEKRKRAVRELEAIA